MTIRLTKKRLGILKVLKQHHGTLSAQEIHKKIPHIDLVTVYRNLELFTQEKLIAEVHLGGNEMQYEYQKEPHHHAVCDSCHKVIHFKAPDKKIKKLLGLDDFVIEEIKVTVRGKCIKD